MTPVLVALIGSCATVLAAYLSTQKKGGVIPKLDEILARLDRVEGRQERMEGRLDRELSRFARAFAVRFAVSPDAQETAGAAPPDES
jgi:hypothetical protein